MRSLLIAPSDSERKMEKALVSGADALILNLTAMTGFIHAGGLGAAFNQAAPCIQASVHGPE